MNKSQSELTAALSAEGVTGNAPAMLIRTMQGHVTHWSPAMEQRYGFTANEAVGQIAHQLLGTIFWKPLAEIEAELVDHKTWGGGLLHRRADGQPAMTAHHWHLHRDFDGHHTLVSELHSDITLTDERCANVLADLIGVLGHQLSQPVTALGNYLSGAARALQPAWPDKALSSQGLSAAAEQMTRIKEGMALFRQLGEQLRASGADAGKSLATQADRTFDAPEAEGRHN